ncbi:hypothetical protein BR93DRAFT_929127 [Coniochaeta sp. PMI_546]|nr:hypothetical protein BR93DRAFT_929127 [Coniochaeta sp. PMI_546]
MPQMIAPGWKWLRPNIAEKPLLIVVALLLALNLSLFTISDSFRSRVHFWPVSGSPDATVVIPVIPKTPLNVSQFGEKGNRVSQLAQWAELLIENPSYDRRLFDDALVTHFPFLAGALASIYTPWSIPGGNGGPQSLQPSFVICAGSNNLNMASHLIRTLRRVHGSQTVIQIAYGGDDDLKPQHRQFLANLESRISFIDLLQRFPAAQRDLVGGGWAMKPFALLAAASSRAILMDADALFLSSPDSLFESHPGLRRTGTLFFHDRAMRAGENSGPAWVEAQLEAGGRQPSTYLSTESLFYRRETWWEQESGVVALDRSNPRALLGLMFATWMNTKDVREQVTYRIFHGDKETFWLAMELSGSEYYFQPWYAGMIGTIPDAEAGFNFTSDRVEVCGRHMVHLDHLGEPFWINGGVYDNKDQPERGYAELTHYLVGSPDGERPEWYPNNNLACLKGTGVRALPDQMRTNLQRIREEASKVDKIISSL